MSGWLSRGYVQVLVVSFVCFCCPGFFNALSGLGGAGSSTPSANAAANATLYFFFALFGYFGGLFFNMFGPRLLMSLGGVTYAFYAVCAYLNGYYSGLTWLFILSGGVLGVGAAFLWCAQGSLMLSYAPKDKRGRYIATFWTIFNIGGFVGGLLQFGLNYSETKGNASAASYFTFTGFMVVGSIAALVLLVNPSTVIKEDGTRVVLESQNSPKQEFMNVASVILDRNMLMLCVYFFASNFFYTFVFNGVNGFVFNMRTRGLNTAIYWAVQMLGAIAFGNILDNKNKTSGQKGLMGFYILAVFMNIVFAAACYLEYGFLKGFNKTHPFTPLIDFTDSNYWFPLILFALYGIGDSMIQTYSYWVLGAIATDNSNLCARYMGYYKGIQSMGGCLSYFLDIEAFSVPYVFQFWCCWVLFAIALPTTFLVAKNLDNHDAKPLQAVAIDSTNVSPTAST